MTAQQLSERFPKATMRLARLNDFLRRNLVWVLILISIYFAFVAANNAKNSQAILESHDRLVNDLKIALCGETPVAECDLGQVINLINDNTDENSKEIRNLERLTACLLLDHDIDLDVPTDIRKQCAEMIRSYPPSTPNDEAPSSQNNDETATSPQNQTPNQTGGGEEEPGFLETLTMPLREAVDFINPFN